MNNKAILILRGSLNYRPRSDKANDSILDGQLFYSKYDRQLYIGDNINYSNLNVKSTKPIGAANLVPGAGIGSVCAIYDKNDGPSGADGSRPTDNSYDPIAQGRNSVALTARAFSYGDCTISGGWNATAYGKGDVAFNCATAGDSDKATSDNETLKDNYLTKSVNGAFAANNGAAKALRSAAFNQATTSGDGGYNFAVNKSTSSGLYAFSANNASAKGEKSAAFGNGTATGAYAFASGISGNATGEASATFGNICFATGDYALAQNKECRADGIASHAGGEYSHATNECAFVHGYFLRTNKDYQTVFGRFNDPADNILFMVGNGDSDIARKNIFSITDDLTALTTPTVNMGTTVNMCSVSNSVASSPVVSMEYDNTLKALKFVFPVSSQT